MVTTKGQPRTQSQAQGLDETIRKTKDYLLGIQDPGGFWWGELESNPSIEAEHILLTHFLGVANKERWEKLARHIINRQSSDGTWCQYYGAPGDLSTSTECYFALKLVGYSADEPFMRRAREFILSKGGVQNTRVFTKIWLALFGQWDWKGIPVLPPEIMLLPNWFPVTIYDFSSWARATIVPISVLIDQKPVRDIPDSARIDELYSEPGRDAVYTIPRPKRLIGWEGLFYTADNLLRYVEKVPWKPTREWALKRAERWIVDHQEADGSWGGIQPPWVYSLMALHSLGYSSDHPVISKGLEGFEGFVVDEGDSMWIQACVSPLWDSCLTMIALLDSGVPADHSALVKAGQRFLNEQIMSGGDWQVKARDVPPGGWAFEFHNDTYPDVDDTSEIIMALDRVDMPSKESQRRAIDSAVTWSLGMQSRNGGWGAFDKDNTKTLIAKIPFADFGEALDPPSADVTAHMLEMLGQLGFSQDHPAVAKAIKYLLAEQEYDGPWFGRWGVNYIYGTAAVLPALRAVGSDMSTDLVRRAVTWIVEHQNADGGWGETCASYVDPAHRGRGPSTASQTAWAMISLIAVGEAASPVTKRGVEYLVRTQRDDGSWDEPYYTGTGFPGYGVGQRLDRYLTEDDPGYQGTDLPAGFMINYRMYRNYWPLMALGRCRTAIGENNKEAEDSRKRTTAA